MNPCLHGLIAYCNLSANLSIGVNVLCVSLYINKKDQQEKFSY